MNDTTPTLAEARDILTPLDLQVIKLVALGLERNDVALEMALSRTRIDRILSKALRLTGSRNSAHLVWNLYLVLNPVPVPERTIRPAVKTWTRAARMVRAAQVASPVDETEEHTNQVLEDIATELERTL